MRWKISGFGSDSSPITMPRTENGAGSRTGQPRTIQGDGGEALEGSNHEVSLIVGGVGGLAEPLAVAFAERGMDVAIIFVQHRAMLAELIKQRVEQAGRRCLLIPNRESDGIAPHVFARRTIESILRAFGRLDVFISLSGRSSANDHPNTNGQRASKRLSFAIPNVAVMKAAMNEIVR